MDKINFKNKAFAFFLWCLFGTMSGCCLWKQHSTHTLTSEKKDSIVTKIKIEREKYDSIIYVPKLLSKLEMDSICDGNKVKHIDVIVGTGESTTHVYTEDGKLKVETKHPETKSTYSKESNNHDSLSSATKEQKKTESKSEVIVKYRVPLWIVISLIVSVLLNLVFIYLKFNIKNILKNVA